MNILVTGGCGFIGANFVHYWLEQYPGETIVNLDALTYAGNLENVAAARERPEYHFVKGSITDAGLVRRTIKEHGIEAIVNFAAETHVDRSILDSAPFIETNIQGVQVLLDAARDVGLERFVQVSTDEVYGSLPLETDEVFCVDSPLAPNSPYAASKAAADLLARAAFHTFGLPVLITRCSNNYGPYQFPEKFIPLFINNALNDQPLPLYGDGRNVRDWIHVRDHCAAVDAVLRRGAPGEVYNIGAENQLPNLEVVHKILELLDKPRELIQFVTDRPGHDRRYAIDNAKIRAELGWELRVAFDDGLAETIAWYRAHAEWLANIVSGDYEDYYDKQYGER
ncbi:dTDP-glucose 4,6-dehydratase [Candidatus Sumerlaeota bacterium]